MCGWKVSKSYGHLKKIMVDYCTIFIEGKEQAK